MERRKWDEKSLVSAERLLCNLIDVSNAQNRNSQRIYLCFRSWEQQWPEAGTALLKLSDIVALLMNLMQFNERFHSCTSQIQQICNSMIIPKSYRSMQVSCELLRL